MFTPRTSFKQLSLTLLAACSVCGANADITHQYTFNDGSLNDSVGTLNGTLNGLGSFSGGSLTLSGGTVSFNAPALAINTYSAFSVGAWATMSSADTGFNTLFGLSMQNGSVPNNYLILQTHRGDNVSRAAISLGTTGSPWASETGANGTQQASGAEHYYVATLDSSSIQLYIDGALAQSTPLSAGNAAGLSGIGTTLASIGSSGYNDPNWQGSVNELDIYNTVLTPSQVTANYTAGPSVVPEPGSMALMALGSTGLLLWRRRQAK